MATVTFKAIGGSKRNERTENLYMYINCSLLPYSGAIPPPPLTVVARASVEFICIHMLLLMDVGWEQLLSSFKNLCLSLVLIKPT